MEEFIKKLIVNIDWTVSVGDILAVISMIVSVVMAIIAGRKSKKAKQYAKNANENNIAAKQYYDSMNSIISLEKPKIENETLKTKIVTYLGLNDIKTTEEIANCFQLTIEKAYNLLKELDMVDKKIETHYDVNYMEIERANQQSKVYWIIKR